MKNEFLVILIKSLFVAKSQIWTRKQQWYMSKQTLYRGLSFSICNSVISKIKCITSLQHSEISFNSQTIDSSTFISPVA